MAQKYFYMGMLGLEILRRGSYENRLIAFYELFGSPNPDARIKVWTPDEVAIVIGLTDETGKPDGRKLSIVRSKAAKKGLLEKVSSRGMYSYRVVPSGGLPDSALMVLNRKGFPGITYCRKDQIPRLMATEHMDELPNIYLWSLKSRPASLADHLPELLDFENADCWDFWISKALNAISGKGHPLRSIEDKDLRLQTALTGLESGLSRNLKTNPDWRPGDPIGWALDALTRYVGRERDWQPMDAEDVRRLRDEAKAKNIETLRHWVLKDFLSDDDQTDEPDGENDTTNTEDVDDDGSYSEDRLGGRAVFGSSYNSLDDAACILDE